jgi:carbonic anhydrase/acetyltransferase-like protein (isoleucine patch superfamily)
MNAVIMDEVELEDECIVGALSFIKQGEKFPSRSLIGKHREQNFTSNYLDSVFKL